MNGYAILAPAISEWKRPTMFDTECDVVSCDSNHALRLARDVDGHFDAKRCDSGSDRANTISQDTIVETFVARVGVGDDQRVRRCARDVIAVAPPLIGDGRSTYRCDGENGVAECMAVSRLIG